MATRKKRWVYKPSKPNVSEELKQMVKQQADELIESVLKPQHLKVLQDNPEFNYLTDIFSKWWRNYFFWCATYACSSPRAIRSTFETKFARMEYNANGRYTLSYFRHTEQWWELYFDLAMEEAFKHICEEPYFHP